MCPERAPEPKVTQLLIFGATVLRVRGSYEDAFQMCQGACERWGWYNRNSAINPYLVEGKKTVGLEICEQLDWQVPDWVAVSVGDGCTIAAVWKAFHEMKTLGLIERTPKMLGVQAAGAAPVTTAFRSGEPLKPIEPQTIADSIAVGVPRNWKKAVLAIQASGGTMINVEDEEILEAMRCAGRLTGIFAEPAAATAVAGVRRAVEEGIIGRKAERSRGGYRQWAERHSERAVSGHKTLRHCAGWNRAGGDLEGPGLDFVGHNTSKTSGLCYCKHMSSISLPSIRNRAGVGLLAVLILVLGSFRTAAQEAKPSPPTRLLQMQRTKISPPKSQLRCPPTRMWRRPCSSKANRSTTRSR